jgi:hypothetical protein
VFSLRIKLKKNRQGLRDLNNLQKNGKPKSEEPACEHNWRKYRPRTLGMKTMSTNEVMHKCSLCDEISSERFIDREFVCEEL